MHIIHAGRAIRLLASLALCASVIAPAAAEPTFKTLYRFKGGHDGAIPVGPLVADKDGKLYGVTTKGGANDWGTVFMLTPPAAPDTVWKKTTLHHFCDPEEDGCGPMAGLTLHRGRLYGTTFYPNGVVFRLSPPVAEGAKWKYEVLHRFTDTPDGLCPTTSVVVDDDGDLYGFTWGGGTRLVSGSTSGAGTLYKITPEGKAPWPETVVHSFGHLTNGEPEIFTTGAGTPSLHPNGAITSTSRRGGAHDYGTVFQVMPGETEPKILYSFGSSMGDGGYPGGVVSDDAGVLYGTTESRIFKLSPPTAPATNWNFSAIHDSTQSGGGYLNGSLALNARGMVFGSTSSGGTRDRGYVFRLTPPNDGDGQWRSSVLYNFRGGGDGASPSSVTLGRGGVLYGSTRAGGTACDCGTVYMIDP